MSFNYLTPKKSVAEIRSSARRSESAQAVAEIMFVKAAREAQLDDTTISERPELFVEWDEYWRGSVGDIVQDEGKLYRCAHEVKNAGQNKKPSENPSKWTLIGTPGEEFPEWVRPTGVHGAYALGAKVTYSGQRWVSNIDKNKWEPGVKGWDKYVEPQTLQKEPEAVAESPEEPPEA